MSLMDKVTGFMTVVAIFAGIPALLLFAGYRRLADDKWFSGVLLVATGAGFAWASYQFMYNVGPHGGG